MGEVRKAEDTKLDRAVALRFLAAHLLNDEEAKARLLVGVELNFRGDYEFNIAAYRLDQPAHGSRLGQTQNHLRSG